MYIIINYFLLVTLGLHVPVRACLGRLVGLGLLVDGSWRSFVGGLAGSSMVGVVEVFRVFVI